MNDSDDQLLQQLGDIGSPKDGTGPPKQTDAAHDPEERQDRQPILLVDLVYLLGASFRDVHYWAGVKKETDTFKQFAKVIDELGLISKTTDTVHILFRGSSAGKIPKKVDYIIKFGDLTVDIQTVHALIKRLGIRAKHLEGRVLKGFNELSDQDIYTICLKIPKRSPKSLEQLRVSLRIISCYNKAVEEDAPIEYFKDGRRHLLAPIQNESGQPDPNLTLLAALNDLTPERMREIITKVSAVTKKPNITQTKLQLTSIYQTIFKIENLRKRLVRPPIELNSDDVPATQRFHKEVSRVADTQRAPAFRGETTDVEESGGTFAAVSDPAGLKTDLFRYVKEAHGNSPETIRQTMNTVYGGDYRQLDMSGLEKRLQLITALLTSLEKSDKGRPIKKGVLQRIQAGVDQVPKDVLDDLVVQDDILKIWDNDNEKIIGKADADLVDIIDTSKDRSAIRRKMGTAMRPDMQFSDQDLDRLAKTFDISIHEAGEIVRLLKGCFDKQENFQRALFEKNLAGFATYKKRIFEILWEFLIGTPRRSDRLPFLNSLQLLVRQIGQPQQAIKTLISDFILDPEEVNLHDRNALMLATQFLRDYNKEINMDIEITLDEVLLVKHGLNQKVARYAAWKIEGEQKRFVKKILTIRRTLLYSFEQEDSDPNVLPSRFTLALEREAHIFLALVGGDTAAAVIRAALNVYGNPASQIYHFKKSSQHAAGLLQHLAVLIRGLGRTGVHTDLALLDGIKKREQEFTRLAGEPGHTAMVRRTLGLIDATKIEINNRASRF
jgi:hypothetical protein